MTFIVAIVGKLETARMPEHVGVDLEFEAGRPTGALDHCLKTADRERRAPLGDEDKV